MKKSFIAENIKDKILFRVFPAFALIVSLISIILPPWFRPLGNQSVHFDLAYQLIHVLSSILFILILVFPGRVFFYTIIGFVFSIYLPLEQADIFYSFLFVAMFLVSIYEQGFFDVRKRVKTGVACFYYLLIIFMQFLVYGKTYFLENFFQYLVCLSLILVSATFVFSVGNISKESAPEEPVEAPKGKSLDLSYFEDLSDREIIIICKILQNDKYDYIARQLGLSEITVKKAAGNIFKKMDCTDKFDFFGKYSNLSIVKGDSVYMSEKKEETPLLWEIISKEKK